MPTYYLMTSLEEPVKKVFEPTVPSHSIRYEQSIEAHIRVSESLNGALLNNLELLREMYQLAGGESLEVRLYTFEIDPKENMYIYDTRDLIENDLAPDAIVTASSWLLNRFVPREIQVLKLSKFLFEKRYIFSNQLNKYYLGHLKDKKLEDNLQNYCEFFSEALIEELFVLEVNYPVDFNIELISSEKNLGEKITIGPVMLPQKVAQWVNDSKSCHRNVDELFHDIDFVADDVERKILSDFAFEHGEDLVKAYHEGYQVLWLKDENNHLIYMICQIKLE